MKETGRKATPEQLERAKQLYRDAATMPVISMSPRRPDWAAQAAQAAQDYVDSIAVAAGLPAYRSWGIRASDGMIMADDTWEEERPPT